jgi:hypothetical protein
MWEVIATTPNGFSFPVGRTHTLQEATTIARLWREQWAASVKPMAFRVEFNKHASPKDRVKVLKLKEAA